MFVSRRGDWGEMCETWPASGNNPAQYKYCVEENNETLIHKTRLSHLFKQDTGVYLRVSACSNAYFEVLEDF